MKPMKFFKFQNDFFKKNSGLGKFNFKAVSRLIWIIISIEFLQTNQFSHFEGFVDENVFRQSVFKEFNRHEQKTYPTKLTL